MGQDALTAAAWQLYERRESALVDPTGRTRDQRRHRIVWWW